MEIPNSWTLPHTCMKCNSTTSHVYVRNTTETIHVCSGCGDKVPQRLTWLDPTKLKDHDVEEIMKYLPNHKINLVEADGYA